MRLAPDRRDIYAGFLSVVVLLALVFLLRLPVLLAVGIALAVYVATRLIVPEPQEVAPGVTRADLKQALRDGEQRTQRIRQLAQSIPSNDVRARVLRIASTANDIYADVRQDPKDLSKIPDFATTYLDPFIGVLDHYTRLVARGSPAGADSTIQSIENMLLPKVETTFGGLYGQLASDDVVDLDAASEGLKAVLDLGTPPS